MFFQHLSTIKVKVADKMIQSAFLCIILNVRAPKKYQLLAVLTRFLIHGIINNYSLKSR